MPSSSSRPSLKRPSLMISSLRTVISSENNHSDSKRELIDDNSDDDADDFLLPHRFHEQQAFETISNTLTDFGLIPHHIKDESTIDTVGYDDNNEDGDDDDDDDDTIATSNNNNSKVGQEGSPLLDQHEDKKKEDDITVTTNERKAKKKTIKPNIEKKKTSSKLLLITPHRRLSKINAYHDGQKESFLSVLEEVDKIQQNTKNSKGFQQQKFTLGLMNCLFIAFFFGKYPQHFWILYATETSFWMSYKFYGMYFAKPLCEVLYYLDFCWVMNTLGVTVIIGMIFLDLHVTTESFPLEWRKKLFIASFGVFCGPVFMAAMTLPFVAFLFHDVNTMANLIIHLMPCMTMYHHRWHAAEISAAYPTIFPHLVEFTEQLNSGKDPASVTKITLLVYFAWFVPYTIWMLLVGLRLPSVSKDKKKPPPKYDTVFHATWKGGPCELVGTTVWKRPEAVSRDESERNDYEIRDFLLYMTGHAVMSCGIGIVLIGDILCYGGGKNVHEALLWLATIICAERGAKRYTYYVTAMYGQKLRRAFHKLEQQQKQQQMQLEMMPSITEDEEEKANREECKDNTTDYGSIDERKECIKKVDQ